LHESVQLALLQVKLLYGVVVMSGHEPLLQLAALVTVPFAHVCERHWVVGNV